LPSLSTRHPEAQALLLRAMQAFARASIAFSAAGGFGAGSLG